MHISNPKWHSNLSIEIFSYWLYPSFSLILKICFFTQYIVNNKSMVGFQKHKHMMYTISTLMRLCFWFPLKVQSKVGLKMLIFKILPLLDLTRLSITSSGHDIPLHSLGFFLIPCKLSRRMPNAIMISTRNEIPVLMGVL